MNKLSLPVLLCLHVLSAGAAELPRSLDTLKILSFDESYSELVDPEAKGWILGEGYSWSEGPVWDVKNQRLLFSDVPQNRIHVWKKGEGVKVWMEPSGFSGPIEQGIRGGSNGLAFDLNGDLLLCEHGDRRIARLTEGGGKVTVADHCDGKRFNSPNDLAVAKDGTIYFTDPPYGLKGHEKSPYYEAGYNGIYRVEKNGDVSCEDKNMTRPNGICLSLDEKKLYVANSDTADRKLMVFGVNPDGSLGKGAKFFDFTPHKKLGKGAPDGIRVDERGNVWTTGPGGIYCISPAGKLLGVIQVGGRVANLCWGEDGYTLFLTARNRLLSIPTKVKAGRVGH